MSEAVSGQNVFGGFVRRREVLSERNANNVADLLNDLLAGNQFLVRSVDRSGTSEDDHGTINSRLESMVNVQTLGAQDVIVIPAHRDYYLTAGTEVIIFRRAAHFFVHHLRGVTKYHFHQVRPA